MCCCKPPPDHPTPRRGCSLKIAHGKVQGGSDPSPPHLEDTDSRIMKAIPAARKSVNHSSMPPHPQKKNPARWTSMTCPPAAAQLPEGRIGRVSGVKTFLFFFLPQPCKTAVTCKQVELRQRRGKQNKKQKRFRHRNKGPVNFKTAARS